MSEMKNFRNIADEAMNNINVSDALKEKTIKRCVKKTYVPFGRLVATAACGVLILGILNLPGVMSNKTPEVGQESTGNQEANLFSATNERTESVPGQSEINILNEAGADNEWQYETIDEAAIGFGTGLLVPAYLPGGFSLETISAAGQDSANAERVLLSYISDDRSFLIIEQKSQETSEFQNYKKVDINGITGFMKTGRTNNEGTAEIQGAPDPNTTVEPAGTGVGFVNTEVHWFKDQIYYFVSGAISEKETLDIARSMKNVKY